MRAKYLLISLLASFIVGMLTSPSYARIDPQYVMGMWLFEVEGDVGMDSSENANDGNVEGDSEWTSDGKFGGGLSDPIADSGIDVYIGTSTYAFSDALKGVLDEVAIFNKALTESEIQEIMTDGLEKATGILAVAPAGKLASTWGSIKG